VITVCCNEKIASTRIALAVRATSEEDQRLQKGGHSGDQAHSEADIDLPPPIETGGDHEPPFR
jgi:hypothetical protein